MRMTRTFTATALAVALGAGSGFAQQTSQPGKQQPSASHHGHAAMEEFASSMDKMHQAMMSKNDADPDRAWALKMIEHHRGGIAMSEIVIKHGDDAEAKKMAQKSADQQKKEIAELESWLERHGGKTPKP